ncbi:MAG: hypothetical protein QM485_12360 [Flavobacteriaceae bacterium]
MKNKFFYLIVVLSVFNVLNSCSTNDSNTDDIITVADIAAIKKVVTSGDWHITYYFDTDKEETSDYNGYVFTFNADGTLGVTNGNTAVSGAWSISDSSTSNDDSIDDDIDFNIFFATPDIFEELSDDWSIQKYSDNKITLIDVSGGNGGTDSLIFEK